MFGLRSAKESVYRSRFTRAEGSKPWPVCPLLSRDLHGYGMVKTPISNCIAPGRHRVSLCLPANVRMLCREAGAGHDA
jgi:hypothetical protein